MIALSGRSVLITGGSRGIGAACAVLFAKSGASVAIIYGRARPSAMEVLRDIRGSGGQGIAIRADVRDFADCMDAVKITRKSFGSVDILVNSAGIWEGSSIDTLSAAKWKRTLEINLGGTINMVRAAVGIMKSKKSGVIVNIASTAGQRGEAGHAHYAASKGGVIALTKSLAVELAPFGIRVNSVSPGWVDTEMVSGVLGRPKNRKAIEKSIPRGSIATAGDIAGPVLFLASDLSKHIVGADISVNGGSVLLS
jgi:3-oxoacyl-[acyl-carrier protein] reductase